MTFRVALSGLNAASADLGVTANNIANIPCFKVGIHRLANTVLRYIKLNTACHVLYSNKTGFAHNTFKHYAASNGNIVFVACF